MPASSAPMEVAADSSNTMRASSSTRCPGGPSSAELLSDRASRPRRPSERLRACIRPCAITYVHSEERRSCGRVLYRCGVSPVGSSPVKSSPIFVHGTADASNETPVTRLATPMTLIPVPEDSSEYCPCVTHGKCTGKHDADHVRLHKTCHHVVLDDARHVLPWRPRVMRPREGSLARMTLPRMPRNLLCLQTV